MVSTVHHGTNADLIAAAASLYLHDGAKVADVTFGKGVFWRKINTGRFLLLTSDIRPVARWQADFRRLPYRDQSLDVVVLDPPYVHNPGVHMTDARYGNKATTKGLSHTDILALYVAGIREAKRVLQPGGRLWVKCKDEVSSGIQQWSHIELYVESLEIGFYARDLFVLVPDAQTSGKRWRSHYHARKTHSYLWIFEVLK